MTGSSGKGGKSILVVVVISCPLVDELFIPSLEEEILSLLQLVKIKGFINNK